MGFCYGDRVADSVPATRASKKKKVSVALGSHEREAGERDKYVHSKSQNNGLSLIRVPNDVLPEQIKSNSCIAR